MISNTLLSVQASATIAISQKAREMISQGLDVITLSAGEPDFDTPEHISLAAVEAIATGHTRYTNVDGIADLKFEICHKFRVDNNLKYSPDQINVSPGGKAVIFNALLATLNPNDEVIIPAPCWVSYPEMVRLCGGDPKIVFCDSLSGFKLTADLLKSAITSKTKWLFLNSPSNPTGACYSAEELKALGAVLLAHPDILVLTDDIYEKIIYDARKFATIASVVPELHDRTLTMNGVSKSYAMTGWRLGYGGGPEWLISAMRKVMSQSTSNPSSITQWAALAALKGPQGFLSDWRKIFQTRRDFVCSEINSIQHLDCLTPQGAFYVFVDCSELIGRTSRSGRDLNSDLEIVNALLEEALVAVVPGSAFHAPGHFRLSFASSQENLNIAMNRIRKFCDACR